MTWYRYWARARERSAAPTFHVKPSGSLAYTADAAVPQSTAQQRQTAATSAMANGHGFVEEPSEHPLRSTVVVANQKGGVGKTTTAISVSASLAQRGQSVLLVDLDAQGNATSGLGLRERGAGESGSPGPDPDRRATVYDVLVDGMDPARAIIPTAITGLRLLPSSIDLAGAEIELVTAFSREQKLARALRNVRDDYDLIIIDCPPSLGLLTVNALTAADAVLVPIQCEYYALEGLGSLQHNIDLIRLHLNPSLRTVGYVMTMHDGRTRLSEQVVSEVEHHFGDQVFDTKVPRSVRLAEAPSYGQPITVFDPASRGAVAYHRVAGELVRRLRRLRPSNQQVHAVAGNQRAPQEHRVPQNQGAPQNHGAQQNSRQGAAR